MDVKVGSWWRGNMGRARVWGVSSDGGLIGYEWDDYSGDVRAVGGFLESFTLEPPECDSFAWQPAPPTKWVDVTAENFREHWNGPCQARRYVGGVMLPGVLHGFVPNSHVGCYTHAVRFHSSEYSSWCYDAQVEVPA